MTTKEFVSYLYSAFLFIFYYIVGLVHVGLVHVGLVHVIGSLYSYEIFFISNAAILYQRRGTYSKAQKEVQFYESFSVGTFTYNNIYFGDNAAIR